MKFMKFLGFILSLCVSIIFFVFIGIFSISIFTRDLLKEEKINNYVTKLDVFSIKANDIFDDTYDKEETIKEVLAEKLDENGIPKGFTISILESEELTNFISNNIKEYSDYILLDKEKPVITKDELFEVVNIEMIENYNNKSLSKKEKEEFDKFITSTVKAINEELPNKDDTIVIPNFIKEIISFINSSNFIIYSVVSFILIFLVIAFFRWSLYKPFIWMGIPGVLSGLILVLTYFGQKILIKYALTATGAIETLFVKMVDTLFYDVLLMGIIVFVIGVLFIVIYKILNKIFYKEEEIIFEEEKKRPSIEEKKLSRS